MKTQVSISPLMFKKDNPINIENCIKDAGSAATEFLAHSDFIRTKHEAGCENMSFESTEEGTLRSAGTVTGVLAGESENEVFFGENIGEAIRTVKSLFKKK